MTKDWCGKVWMNHPFGRGLNEKWVGKLIEEWESRRASQAVCITYACTSERWFQPLMQFPQCFLAPRTNYLTPDGKVFKGVTKGSVVTYLPDDEGDRMGLWRFVKAFESMGMCKLPVKLAEEDNA